MSAKAKTYVFASESKAIGSKAGWMVGRGVPRGNAYGSSYRVVGDAV